MSEVLVTSKAIAAYGSDGHVRSADGLIDLNLVGSIRSNEGSGADPEQLFAAAYAACFDGALQLAAKKKKGSIDSETTVEVRLYKDTDYGGYKITVHLDVRIEGVNPEEAEELASKAYQICPYSKATRGNITVTLNPMAVEKPS
ncbi:Ohr family peroxiredoxin [Lentibacillus cibarius]|uniref:Ohr family peroxiredoxin n=1 Tax=Lentibacillus cibarius TaxID=2583219 RepID=A0A549YKD1_9BACI|nr:Ohr family peroxiredoxin [Lentibacillus cibarius]TRM12342.1 Ohr family peroxiredoxin [Lentibacillus cibarius]